VGRCRSEYEEEEIDMPLSTAVDYVLLPRRIYSATLVVLVSTILWLVGLVPGSGLFPVTLAHKITMPQAQDPIISRGNPHLPEITLTFDDGPNPPYTSQILAILKRFGIQATFFCIGNQVAAHPGIVQQEFAAGNTIGNHTWSHPSLPTLSASQIRAQLTMTSDIVQYITGMRPTFFRPPYGALSAQVLAQVNQLGLTTVLWSVDPRDWSLPGVNVIISRVLSQTGDGAIILMHDGGGNRSQTVAALPIIIETLQQRGFHFVTLQQLAADLKV
jgi:peptidoglycan/xylan/chitin deacetylase (PgdA/CDA1 family)